MKRGGGGRRERQRGVPGRRGGRRKGEGGKEGKQ